MVKVEELLKKHKIRMLGAWTADPAGHQTFWVVEAPSLETFQEFGIEPETLATLAYCTMEIEMVMSLEEEMKLRQQATLSSA